MHRRKGENAQQVIDLTAAVKEKDAALDERAARLAAAEQRLEAARSELSRARAQIHELEATSQLLKDEYQTLQLALTTAERKLVEAQKDNDRLVAQLIELKEKDVARMNQENDDFARIKQEEVRRQLEEAARENKTVVNTTPKRYGEELFHVIIFEEN